MKSLSTFIFFFLLSLVVTAQNKSLVYTSDIDHFWMAYDSAKTTNDTLKQKDFYQRLYVDQASDGLKEFMRVRNYSAPLYVKLINQYPKFWASIRKNTLSVKEQVPAIEKSLVQFKSIYPELRPAHIYFTVGGLRSGGTTTGDKVLVGTEIATADSLIDASELSTWLQNAFKTQKAGNLVDLNVHEYVHTQQKDLDGGSLLGQSLAEGCADFVAALVTGDAQNSPYTQYGLAHESELKARFKLFMLSSTMNEWLYNGGSGTAHPDLGYFMGYRICEAYYQKTKNKKAAVKTMIELDYSNPEVALDFLQRSGYYAEALDKTKLMGDFESKRPSITSRLPVLKDPTDSVSAATTEMTFYFSEVMGKGFSISRSADKAVQYPIAGVIGWGDDHRSF